MPAHRRLRSVALSALLVVSLPACARDSSRSGPFIGSTLTAPVVETAAPAAHDDARHHADGFPLQIGDRWLHLRVIRVRILNGDAVEAREVFRALVERELIGTETRNGRVYVVEERRILGELGRVDITEWVRYRQDRPGLFEANLSRYLPPILDGGGAPRAGSERRLHDLYLEAGARALGDRLDALDAWRRVVARWEPQVGTQAAAPVVPGPLPDELYRLRYPLRPRAEWMIGGAPPFHARVEAGEHLELPAGRLRGHRLSVTGPLIKDNESVREWYGPCGFLRRLSHFESSNGPASRRPELLVIDGEEVMLEHTLADHPRCPGA